MNLIHYGSNKYNPDLFTPIKNQIGWNKPASGGLWTSPINSKYGWKDWCDYNEYDECKLSFNLTITTNRILIIDTLDDLKNAIKIRKRCTKSQVINSLSNNYLNFEAIAEKYDVIHLTLHGLIVEKILLVKMSGLIKN